MSAPAPAEAKGLTATQWLICVIASIGFAFDIYELLMLPLVLPPALPELTGAVAGSPEYLRWLGIMFYVPAFVGGIFGLLGGYLTDRLGRRRVLTWSILLYAFSAFGAGYSTSVEMLLVLRCTTFVGVCIEFVAAVAWLAELFDDPHRREKVLGYTQAFSSVGGLLVAVVAGVASDYANVLPAIAIPDWLGGGADLVRESHSAWRYTLMSGLIPAIPLIVIRPFLPESPAWAAKKASGTLKRPSLGELFAPRLRRTTIVTTLMFACSYGAAFGAIQQMPQLVPGLANVRAETEGKPIPAQKKITGTIAAEYTKVQEIGGLIGRFLLALLALRIVSRRSLLRIFQWPGAIFMPLVFWFFLKMDNHEFFTVDLSSVYLGHLPFTKVSVAVMLCGLLTVAQFSFWGNYLPRVYPMHLRGTGESFAANIGGRMLGTSCALITTTLASQSFLPGESPPAKMAHAAAIVAAGVYLIGSVLSFFLPEPPSDLASDD
jgi:MFS family permease